MTSDNWAAGRIWGRRGCNFEAVQGPESCLTGGCEGGLNCTQGGIPPCTLAEFTLSPTFNASDYYDVSLREGFDLPMRISNNKGCPDAQCAVDLNSICPDALKGTADPSGLTVACRTACQANLDGNQANSTNCCSGAFSTPETCPSNSIAFNDFFKGNCPDSFTFAFDEASGTALKTCDGSNQADCTYIGSSSAGVAY
ncbi:hypothetical protein FRC12_002023 [Ceratobasidium sp. 428]|nr:hypothetical protein FRC12_002023 [Ceratobasidium sp. 428]